MNKYFIYRKFITSSVRKMQNIVTSMFLSLSDSISLKPHGRTSPTFAVHVACGYGLVPVWRHCDKLCTSGFVDDVMFSHSGRCGASCVFLIGQGASAETTTTSILSTFWSKIKISKYIYVGCAPGAQYAVYNGLIVSWVCKSKSPFLV